MSIRQALIAQLSHSLNKEMNSKEDRAKRTEISVRFSKDCNNLPAAAKDINLIFKHEKGTGNTNGKIIRSLRYVRQMQATNRHCK